VSPRSWEARLRDILDAVDEILDFTAGMDEDSLAADAKTLKAVLADFAIIGEAATHLPEEVTDSHPGLPWRSMRAMRNLVIHAYFHVEPALSGRRSRTTCQAWPPRFAPSWKPRPEAPAPRP
jgi:uncharacterized protein with HEPN domain